MTIEPENDAERLLLEKVQSGEIADVSELPDSTVRAALLYDLCVHPNDCSVNPKGIQLRGARISGQLDLEGTTVVHPVWLWDCHFEAPIILREARTRTVGFDGSTVPGIAADRLRLEGMLSLRRVTTEGEVRLTGAQINGNFTCRAATLENPGGDAMIADGITVTGSVFLDKDFAAKGEVRLVGGTIGGNLACGEASFDNSGKHALSFDRVTVGGSVFLDEGFAAKGEVRFLGAQIDGDLICADANFDAGSPDEDAFSAGRMNVQALFVWRLERAPVGVVSFDHAHVGRLVDNARSWPASGRLNLDGFTYDSLAWDAPVAWRERRTWLELQHHEDFRPQPYEQLVAVLRRMGHERDARQIAISKHDAYLKRGDPSRRRRLWMGFLRATIGYGYEPWRALGYMAFAVFFSWMIFSNAYHYGVMHPSKEKVYLHDCYTGQASSCKGWSAFDRRWSKEPIQLPADYPEFNSFVYAVDTFLPIVDLHQENYWLPRGDGDWGWFFRLYLWLHIAFGWLLSTVAVFGLTGIIKKD